MKDDRDKDDGRAVPSWSSNQCSSIDPKSYHPLSLHLYCHIGVQKLGC